MCIFISQGERGPQGLPGPRGEEGCPGVTGPKVSVISNYGILPISLFHPLSLWKTLIQHGMVSWFLLRRRFSQKLSLKEGLNANSLLGADFSKHMQGVEKLGRSGRWPRKGALAIRLLPRVDRA